MISDNFKYFPDTAGWLRSFQFPLLRKNEVSWIILVKQRSLLAFPGKKEEKLVNANFKHSI